MIYNLSKEADLIQFTKRTHKVVKKQAIVELKEKLRIKTLSQNNYIWLVFTHIAEQEGMRYNDVYYYYLDRFPKFKNITALTGEKKLVRISQSSFDKDQMRVFIDEVVTDARMEGYNIPDPEDFKAIQMFNYYQEEGK